MDCEDSPLSLFLLYSLNSFHFWFVLWCRLSLDVNQSLTSWGGNQSATQSLRGIAQERAKALRGKKRRNGAKHLGEFALFELYLLLFLLIVSITKLGDLGEPLVFINLLIRTLNLFNEFFSW